ncbi:MAG: hypothetical protein NZ874_05425 [Fimbriimonadales bacterium]|nr:hypothetical protein [Fimbriimonadales bacterium]
MPRNKAIYVGVLVVAASALLYIGGQIIRLIEWFLPWSTAVGIGLILIGLYAEMQKARKPKLLGDETAATAPKPTDATQTGSKQ